MIVVDTDVIAAFWIRTKRTGTALSVRRKDPDWVAPLLWRSEFRSVLRQYMNASEIDPSDALLLSNHALAMFHDREYLVDGNHVLRLVHQNGHSSYDCEFIALANRLKLSLVTGDRSLVRKFPATAILMEDFIQ